MGGFLGASALKEAVIRAMAKNNSPTESFLLEPRIILRLYGTQHSIGGVACQRPIQSEYVFWGTEFL
jgi:hypothetical protein